MVDQFGKQGRAKLVALDQMGRVQVRSEEYRSDDTGPGQITRAQVRYASWGWLRTEKDV